MKTSSRFWLPLSMMGLAAALCVTTTVVNATKVVVIDLEDAVEEDADARAADKSVDRLNRPVPAPKAALRVYEWGAERENWDGSKVKPNDVPDFYYSPSEVPLGPAAQYPDKPVVEDPEEMEPQIDPQEDVMDKPVVYFECDSDMAFHFEVKSLTGKMTWMYPKPSRRVDEATAQWDEIKVYPDNVRRANSFKLPEFQKAASNHWAAFSRDGATSTIVVNGEAERFLFYECTNRDLPELDVFKDSDGKFVIRNYSCCPVHDVRLRLKLDTADSYRAWYVSEIPAARGNAPYDMKLVEGSLVDLADVRKPGTLTAETQAAGLTKTQAQVFERCWRDEFLMGDEGALTYRRDPKLLDELAGLNLPAGIKAEFHRVGYMYVGKIDLTRQAEMDKLAKSLAEGDKDAADKLAKLGMAGSGAVRRLMNDSSLALKQRLALAAWLKNRGK